MNAFTKMSGKGQVVVPKVLRDRKGWRAGIDLEVVDYGDGVILRPRRYVTALPVSDAIARIRALYKHEGPPIPVEQLGWNADWDQSDA